jgi:hypothetical protein
MADVSEVLPPELEALLNGVGYQQPVITNPFSAQATQVTPSRIPTILTRESWINSESRAWMESLGWRGGPSEAELGTAGYIMAGVNPSEVSFRMALRSSEQKTKGGTVTHTWFDKHRNTFFDEPVVSFTFQSGNCMPVFEQQSGTLSVPKGLDTFNYFMELVDTHNSLPDGRPNYVYIIHTSLKFPQLTLVGFFNPSGVNFSDSSGEPSQFTWTADFIVHFTQPRLNSAAELQARYLEVHTELGTSRPDFTSTAFRATR